jgi:hypothetical protein
MFTFNVFTVSSILAAWLISYIFIQTKLLKQSTNDRFINVMLYSVIGTFIIGLFLTGGVV